MSSLSIFLFIGNYNYKSW